MKTFSREEITPFRATDKGDRVSHGSFAEHAPSAPNPLPAWKCWNVALRLPAAVTTPYHIPAASQRLHPLSQRPGPPPSQLIPPVVQTPYASRLRGIRDVQTDGDMDSYHQVELGGASTLPAFTTLPPWSWGYFSVPMNWACPGSWTYSETEGRNHSGVWSPGCMPATHLGRSLYPASGWGSHAQPEMRVLTFSG